MRGHRFIQSVVRTLKRRLGEQVILVNQNAAGTPDYTTGVRTGRTESSKTIRKAIVQQARNGRKFSYDLSYIAANKNFTYGGFYDSSTRTVLIDNKDLGVFVIDLDTTVTYNSKQYEVKEVAEYEGNVATLLTIVKTEGQR